MRWRALLGAAIASAVLSTAPPAHAVTVPINGPWWAQRAVDEMRVPVAPEQTVILGACPGYAGASGCNFDTADSPIYIDPDPLMGQVGAMREVLYRELGGRFATLAMTPAVLAYFEHLARRGHATASALGTGTPEWQQTAEVFEDAYADCALGLHPHRETLQRSDSAWVDTSGYRPNASRARRVCSLIRWMGAAAGWRVPAVR